jgi:acetyl esterase/lipase
MRIIFGLLTGILVPVLVHAAPPADPAKVATTQEAPWVNLWPGKAPHALGEEKADTPALQIFLPVAGTATGSAIVVCPGGGYGHLAPHEGGKIGQWLAENGVTAFVLRYRLAPKYHYPAEIEDGQRAVRFVRAHAADYGIDPHRIGIIGFSAGGHLTSSVATHYTAGDPKSEDPVDRVSSRPDLHIVIYPVIKMVGPDSHAGSRKNLLGPEPDPKLMELFSNEKQVTKDTPPAFVVHSVTDKTVPVSNSDAYVEALRLAGVEYVYVRIDHGPHGFGLTDDWAKPCIDWLRRMKF